ncbi:SDR family oxidoreductase [Mycolicibacterium vinylchloridicum]|uniref:SDR family oxidoreductase n=1 Tax=Mycolicibacterium vinylchloridicum TaxID=2736928 RepID=UPI0015CD35E5|nr:SDR family oxidoreductase [Mycolicibacterium vinylchloridicum]
MPTSSLEGRVALVTGAGRGIGRAHALLMAQRGARVVVSDLGVGLDGAGGDSSVAEGVVAEILAAGGEAVADCNDIASFAGSAAAVDAGVQAFGKVDIVVNNAGLPGGAAIEDLTEEQLQRALALHLYGPLGAAKAAWPMMRAQGWGRVINTVSEEAFPAKADLGRGGLGLIYGPAKAAVWSATIGLANEGRACGITVNAISPGAFTRMNASVFEKSPTTLDLDPVHVARVAAWLASDDAADVTATVIHVAGVHRREYSMRRHADTAVIARIDSAIGG